MLRACFDLLKPGGRLAFTTIYIAAGVSERDYRRAARARGPGIAERRAMTELLETAGFLDITESDVTGAFGRTTRAYLETSERYGDELSAHWGSARFAESQRNRRATLALIRDGIVRRGLFTARRPSPQSPPGGTRGRSRRAP